MNAIDVGRNELARLGLHPGARHPNIADSTPFMKLKGYHCEWA